MMHYLLDRQVELSLEVQQHSTNPAFGFCAPVHQALGGGGLAAETFWERLKFLPT